MFTSPSAHHGLPLCHLSGAVQLEPAPALLITQLHTQARGVNHTSREALWVVSRASGKWNLQGQECFMKGQGGQRWEEARWCSHAWSWHQLANHQGANIKEQSSRVKGQSSRGNNQLGNHAVQQTVPQLTTPQKGMVITHSHAMPCQFTKGPGQGVPWEGSWTHVHD